MNIRSCRWASLIFASTIAAKHIKLSSKHRHCHQVEQEVNGTVGVESNVEKGSDETADLWWQLRRDPPPVPTVYEVQSIKRACKDEENETDGQHHGGQSMDVPLPADLTCRADDATYGDEICNYDDDERRDT